MKSKLLQARNDTVPIFLSRPNWFIWRLGSLALFNRLKLKMIYVEFDAMLLSNLFSLCVQTLKTQNFREKGLVFAIKFYVCLRKVGLKNNTERLSFYLKNNGRLLYFVPEKSMVRLGTQLLKWIWKERGNETRFITWKTTFKM